MHRPSSVILLAGGLVLIVAAGCVRYYDDEWSQRWPDRVPTSGAVLLDSQPVEGATVIFVTTQNGKGYNAVGLTDSAGRFKLRTFRRHDGAVAGEHMVQIEKVTSSAPPANLPLEASFTPVETSHLPAKYRSTKTSGLTATVTEEGPNEFIYELTSK